MFVDVSLSFVVIPSSYILSTEVIKRFIITNGRMNPLRNLLRSSNIDIAPKNNMEMKENANAE